MQSEQGSHVLSGRSGRRPAVSRGLWTAHWAEGCALTSCWQRLGWAPAAGSFRPCLGTCKQVPNMRVGPSTLLLTGMATKHKLSAAAHHAHRADARQRREGSVWQQPSALVLACR